MANIGVLFLHADNNSSYDTILISIHVEYRDVSGCPDLCKIKRQDKQDTFIILLLSYNIPFSKLDADKKYSS